MLSWAHPSPNPKRHLDRFSRFCTVPSERLYTVLLVVYAVTLITSGVFAALAYAAKTVITLNERAVEVRSVLFATFCTLSLSDGFRCDHAHARIHNNNA